MNQWVEVTKTKENCDVHLPGKSNNQENRKSLRLFHRGSDSLNFENFDESR